MFNITKLMNWEQLIYHFHMKFTTHTIYWEHFQVHHMPRRSPLKERPHPLTLPPPPRLSGGLLISPECTTF